MIIASVSLDVFRSRRPGQCLLCCSLLYDCKRKSKAGIENAQEQIIERFVSYCIDMLRNKELFKIQSSRIVECSFFFFNLLLPPAAVTDSIRSSEQVRLAYWPKSWGRVCVEAEAGHLMFLGR